MPANPTTLSASPLVTNSDLSHINLQSIKNQIIDSFKALKNIKIKHVNNEGGQDWPHKKPKYHLQTIGVNC
jgi:hypothetical protein